MCRRNYKKYASKRRAVRTLLTEIKLKNPKPMEPVTVGDKDPRSRERQGTKRTLKLKRRRSDPLRCAFVIATAIVYNAVVFAQSLVLFRALALALASNFCMGIPTASMRWVPSRVPPWHWRALLRGGTFNPTTSSNLPTNPTHTHTKTQDKNKHNKAQSNTTSPQPSK